MVFGGIARARYQFNEDTLWTGGPRPYARPGAAESLPEIRRLLVAGQQQAAEDLAMRVFMSDPIRQMAYQPFGDIELTFDHADPLRYYRQLDLDTAIATTEYELAGKKIFRRESFASYPARAIVIHLGGTTGDAFDFSATLSSPHEDAAVEPSGGRTLVLQGRVRDTVDRYRGHSAGKIRFAAHLHILETDGKVRTDADHLSVKNATSATLVLTGATNFVSYRDLSADPLAQSTRFGWSHEPDVCTTSRGPRGRSPATLSPSRLAVGHQPDIRNSSARRADRRSAAGILGPSRSGTCKIAF